MNIIFAFTILSIITLSSANLRGPFLLWSQEENFKLQENNLRHFSEFDYDNIYKSYNEIIIYVRNNTNRLDEINWPKFKNLIKNSQYTYWPQNELIAEPFDYTNNVTVITLSQNPSDEDAQIVSNFKKSSTINGIGKVLGILVYNKEPAHWISKREVKEETTTSVPPQTDENDKSFIYVATGNKTVLHVNAAPKLEISNETIILIDHMKAITFDDQKAKGYGRLNIIFSVDNEKLFLRFNFTLTRGTWYMKAVEVEYKNNKTVLSIVGDLHNMPSAPLGFSYRCSAQQAVFTNGLDTLTLTDYQVQPWLNGALKFGDVYDCVGFVTSPILAGIFVSFFLCGILSIGILALLDVNTPNRFESSRSKQLTFTVQD